MHPNLPDDEVLEWLNTSNVKMVNRYPDIKVLAHKDVFSNAMRVCMDLDPERFNFVPPTFRLPSTVDEQRFLAYKG